MANTKAKILVVEDEKGIRNLLSYELTQRGYSVDTASDGEEGVEKVKNDRYDLVISDIIMPKMNGLQALKQIKKVSPETEVIIITGYATVENALQSMRDGAYDFIQKPFNLSELVTLVDKALEKGELKTIVALYETSQAVHSTLRLEELLPMMIKLLRDVVKADEIALLLYDHEHQLYIAASSFPLSENNLRDFYVRLGTRVAQAKIDKPSHLTADLFEKEPLPTAIKNELEDKSIIICPIQLQKKRFGKLFVSRKKARSSFMNSDIRNLSIFVSQIAQSIANTKLYEQLEIKIAELESANKKLEKAKSKLPKEDEE